MFNDTMTPSIEHLALSERRSIFQQQPKGAKKRIMRTENLRGSMWIRIQDNKNQRTLISFEANLMLV